MAAWHFDVAKLVSEVAATAQPLVAKNANKLEVNCPKSLAVMKADQTKARQTLFNLLGKASKFTEKGTISLKVGQASRLPLCAETESNSSSAGWEENRRDACPTFTFTVTLPHTVTEPGK